MGLYEKLGKAKFKFHHTEIKKTGYNSFAKYNYMQLVDITNPIIECLHEFGLVSFVSFTETLATLTIVDTETDNQMQVTSPMSSASLKGCHAVQNLGAVQTYIRRYLYSALFDIVEGDAIDGSEPLKPTNMDCTKLIELGHEKGISAKDIDKKSQKLFGHSLEYVTQEELQKLKQLIEAK